MRTKVLRGAADIRARFDSIASLFSICYAKPIDPTIWNKFYLNAPTGAATGVPIGVLINRESDLLGFYGLVPQRLVAPNGRVDYMLGIMLMLHPDFRAAEVFVELIRAAMAAASAEGARFVMGFPNAQSYLPLVRLCGWRLLLDTVFVEFPAKETAKREEDLEISPIPAPATGDEWCVPYRDPAYMSWRSARHRYRMVAADGVQVVYKIFESRTLDIMDAVRETREADALAALKHLAATERCDRVLLTRHHAERLALPEGALKSAGAYTLRMCVYPAVDLTGGIHLSLLMSDVF